MEEQNKQPGTQSYAVGFGVLAAIAIVIWLVMTSDGANKDDAEAQQDSVNTESAQLTGEEEDQRRDLSVREMDADLEKTIEKMKEDGFLKEMRTSSHEV